MKRFMYNWFKQVVLFFAGAYILFVESLNKKSDNFISNRCDICKMKFIDENDINECKKCHKIVCGGCMTLARKFWTDGSTDERCLICEEEHWKVRDNL